MKTRRLTWIAVLTAISFIIMFLEVSIPLMPVFLKVDFSELPAIYAGFTMGPVAGILVVLLKNILHLFISSNMGIGEVANFLVGASLVGTTSIMYQRAKLSMITSMIVGVLNMTLVALIVNIIFIIPVYEAILNLPIEKIIAITNKVNPLVDNIYTYLGLVIIPFNLIKGLVVTSLSYILLTKYQLAHSREGGISNEKRLTV